MAFAWSADRAGDLGDDVGRRGSYARFVTRVLIVEPDERLKRMMGWVLIDAGFAVVCASDFDEALERLPEVKPDITLLDVDGTEGMCADPIGAVRTRWRDGHVIDLQPQYAQEITTADATLTKPLHVQAFLDAMHELSGARASGT